MAPRDIRKAARQSQARTAVYAGVSEPLLRLYEANPAAVRDERKRAALDAEYRRLAAQINAEVRAAG